MLHYDDVYQIMVKDNYIEFSNVMKRFNINYFGTGDSLHSSILSAISYGSENILKLLIKKGVDLDVLFSDTEEGNVTALEYYLISRRGAFDTGCGKQPLPHILKLFEDKNINLNLDNLKEYGLPETKMLEILVEGGANINLPYEKGKTILDTAVQLEHWTGILYLLSKGAKHSKSFFNDEIKKMIKEKGEGLFILIPHLKTLKEEDCIETEEPKIFHYELERIKIRNDKVNIPYNIGFLNWIDLENNNINELDKLGLTPLDFAIELGNNIAVDYLIKNGAKRSSEL